MKFCGINFIKQFDLIYIYIYIYIIEGNINIIIDFINK